MNTHRGARRILKVLTCSIGGAIVGLVVFFLFLIRGTLIEEGVNVALTYALIGAGPGLFVGISWAIERREVRTAFVVPSVFGFLVALVTFVMPFLGLYRGGSSLAADRFLFAVFTMALPVGLFIGIV